MSGWYRLKILKALVVSCVGLVVSVSAMAHTSEIFFAQADTDNEFNKPHANVLFMIDTSGSMCFYPGGGNNQNCSRNDTRMAELQKAFNVVIDGLAKEVSVGVGKFGKGVGGYVFFPVSDLEGQQSKALIKSTVGDLRGSGGTPTMAAYAEMASYMVGAAPTEGAKQGYATEKMPVQAVNISCTGSGRRRECTSVPFHTSPVDLNNQCESNHIIMMTDGGPSGDNDFASVTNLMSTGRNSCYSADLNRYFQGSEEQKKSFACQTTLASWLHDEQRNSIGRSIKTWQVAFGVGADSAEVKNMQVVAEAGGTDRVRYADNAEELAAQFVEIMDLIQKDAKTISAPGVAVNQMNRLQHLGQLYYSVFHPDKINVWEGNLKRYAISDSEIIDRNGAEAVDESTGFFSESARSWWSATADGPDASKGGARGQLAGRTLYVSNPAGTSIGRMDSSQQFYLPSGTTVTQENVYQKLMTAWGDPFHSAPLMVNYSAPSAKEEEQDNVVFVSTNAGMLHAIDSRNGAELFSFMPYELVRDAYYFMYPEPLLADNTRRRYGLDGNWIGWRRGPAGAETPEAVYLYGGMRRGGYSYYALDVTNKSAPKMQWTIHGRGGQGCALGETQCVSSEDNQQGGHATYDVETTPGFELLGQTWSTPTLTQIRLQGEKRAVLVFGGGYDPRYGAHDKGVDENGYRLAARARSQRDEVGRAVYMVDAETGKLLWSASSANTSGVAGVGHYKVPDMKWAVPGSIAVVDIDLDGVADFLYLADLGGQVFRVDIDGEATATGEIAKQVVRIADLGGSSVASNRRFYEAPTVAYSEQGGRHLVVSIGSGYASHPLDFATQERIFSFRDDGALSGEAEVPLVVQGKLLDVTDNLSPSNDAFEGKVGWFINLPSQAGSQARKGEKVLASPAVINGRLLVTTYAPYDTSDNVDACKVSLGRSYLYTMDLSTGRPALLNSGEVPGSGGSEQRRERQLQSQTPVATPQIIGQPNGGLAVVVGTEIIGDVDGGNMELRKRRWFPLPRNQANEFFPSQAEPGDEP